VRSQKAKTILLGGGVAANGPLRKAFADLAESMGLKLLIAEKKHCTDNAVMIASLAYHKFKAGIFADMKLEAKATGTD